MVLKRKLITLGACVFAVFLVSQLPARLLFIAIPDTVAQGFGAEGTIWNGKVRIINVAGLQLRNTEWNLAVSRLLLGQLAMNYKTRWGGGFAEGFAAASITGNLSFADTLASLNVAALSPLLNMPRLGGQLSLNLKQLELVDNWPRSINGELEIRNLSAQLLESGQTDMIGNLAVSFDGTTNVDETGVTGILRDTGGPLELDGTIVLSAPSAYEINTRVRARPDAPKSTRDSLRFLGAPESDGRYIFNLAGSI